MTGFEPGFSGTGSDRAINCATATAHKKEMFGIIKTRLKSVLWRQEIIADDYLNENKSNFVFIFCNKSEQSLFS